MAEKNNNLFGVDTSPWHAGKLDGKYRDKWVEESLYFEKKKSKQQQTNATREHLGINLSHKKTRMLLWFLFFIFFLIFSRLFYLQILQGDFYRLAAENNRQRLVSIPAERGLIYDRNGVVITKNIPNFSLLLVPQNLPKEPEARAKLIAKLSSLINKTETEIKEILKEYGAYSFESIIIQEDIDYETALSVLLSLGDLPGIRIQRGSKRLYLNYDENSLTTSTPSSLSHLLGYTGKLNMEELNKFYKRGYLPSDIIGKTGVEKIYETLLRGAYGQRRIEVNATGKEQAILAEELPKPGYHLELTIDKKMQNELERIIFAYLKNSPTKRAAAIALSPKTGEIFSLISLPSFDNNDFSGGIKKEEYQNYFADKDEPLFNRAISGLYPSGSTVKPAIAAAGLEEGIINANTSFLSTGGLQVGNWFFPDWQAGGHGVTNVREALAWSINTFFYYLGGGYGDFAGLGVERMTAYLKKFGFSELSGIDLPAEKNGFLPSKDWKEKTKNEKWYVGDTYNLSIGQGDILVTPLQIADMTMVFANRGTLYKPRVAKAIIDPVNKNQQEIKPEIIRANFIKPENIATVRLGMKDCVSYGSCRRLATLPFVVAGKTGTAQWNKNKTNHAWFTSFAPFDNPEIVLTILIEEGGEGSSIAVPIAYDFYQWWWAYRSKLTQTK